MPLDFPNSPTTGQVYSGGQSAWQFDGTKWVPSGTGTLAFIGDTPPTPATPGLLWWNSSPGSGQLFIWFNDGSSAQWVAANNMGGGLYLPITGGNLTGALTVNLNPTTPPAFLQGTPGLSLYSSNGTNANINVYGSGGAPIISTTNIGGSLAAPVAIATAQWLGMWATQGTDSPTTIGSGPRLNAENTEAWSASAHGSAWRFVTVANGTTALRSAMYLQQGLQLNDSGGNPPTGGDKGAGTVNIAAGYYVNGRNVTPGQIGAASAMPGNVPAHGPTGMMGLGYTYTPQTSTRVLAVITGSIVYDGTNITGSAHLRYGTGTPPAFGAASTGTTLNSQQATLSTANLLQIPCTLVGMATGLTIGTTYWFDVYQAISSGNGDFFTTGYTFVEV